MFMLRVFVVFVIYFFFFKQKTAYEMRISDWSSDVCSSDLKTALPVRSRTKIYAVIPASDNPRAPQRPGKKWKRSKATTQSKAISRTIPTLRVGSIPTGWGARTNNLASDAASRAGKRPLRRPGSVRSGSPQAGGTAVRSGRSRAAQRARLAACKTRLRFPYAHGSFHRVRPVAAGQYRT